MKISMINGSPKLGENNSALLIELLQAKLQSHETVVYSFNKCLLNEAQTKEVEQSDVLIFVFPLYIDSIPSHLLRCLIELNHKAWFRPNTKVYCVLNNGFFEGQQNHIAMENMRNWCRKTGVSWGQGIAMGAGEMLPFIRNIPLGHGPNKNLGRAMDALTSHILTLSDGEDIYFSPNFPRLLWKLQAHQFWYSRGKANGVKRKMLFH